MTARVPPKKTYFAYILERRTKEETSWDEGSLMLLSYLEGNQ